MTGETKKVDMTTGVGRVSFPRLFLQTKGTKDDGSDVYDLMLMIPKDQREDLKAIVRAIKEVGMAKWGANYTKFGLPLRDADKEADDLTDDGKTTKGEKYPERLGHYFMNCRSSKPVAVVGRDRSPIVNPDDLYGGCYAKVNVTFYPYNTKGNQGIAAGLNGVQFIRDGEPLGAGAKTVDSMFDLLDDEDDAGLDSGLDGLDDEVGEEAVEETPAPAKKAAAKKAPAKKAAAPAALTPAQKKAKAARAAAAAALAEAEAAEAEEGGDDEDPAAMLGDDDADSMYDDLDDSDS